MLTPSSKVPCHRFFWRGNLKKSGISGRRYPNEQTADWRFQTDENRTTDEDGYSNSRVLRLLDESQQTTSADQQSRQELKWDNFFPNSPSATPKAKPGHDEIFKQLVASRRSIFLPAE
jgi:hypothetical protein